MQIARDQGDAAPRRQSGSRARAAKGPGRSQGRRHRARTARTAKGKNGQGKSGKGGERLRDFNSRAGRQGQRAPPRRPAAATRASLPLGGERNQRPRQAPGRPGPERRRRHRRPSTTPTSSATDPRCAERNDTRVAGQRGRRASRAARRPSSARPTRASPRRAYKRVYGDYTSVVEEVMSKEKVPPGYRFYVKRYFQLIKPRE